MRTFLSRRRMRRELLEQQRRDLQYRTQERLEQLRREGLSGNQALVAEDVDTVQREDWVKLKEWMIFFVLLLGACVLLRLYSPWTFTEIWAHIW